MKKVIKRGLDLILCAALISSISFCFAWSDVSQYADTDVMEMSLSDLASLRTVDSRIKDQLSETQQDYDKQSNRAPTGTTILNARWSQVYLYTPSNGYGLWGTAATTFAHKTAQTSTLANKVSVSITTKWSEDTTNILYQ